MPTAMENGRDRNGWLTAALRVLAIGYAGALTFVLLHPDAFTLLGLGAKSVESQVDASVPGFLQHLSAYLLLGIVLQAGFGGQCGPARGVFLFTILHGGVTEAIQAVVPNRTADWFDLAANVSGAVLSAAACQGIARWACSGGPAARLAAETLSVGPNGAECSSPAGDGCARAPSRRSMDIT